MPFFVAAGAAIAGSVVSSALAPSPSGGGGGAAAADPFASQRPMYQQMLANMMTGTSGGGGGATPIGGPTGITGGAGWDNFGAWAAPAPAAAPTATGTTGFTPQDPSYAWRFQQGLEGVNAGAAAGGMLNSGNRLLALENYGQGAASQEYANQFSRLSQLAGANIGSPAAAGQIIAGQTTANQQAASAIGNAVSSGIKGWGNQLSYTPQSDVNAQVGGMGGGSLVDPSTFTAPVQQTY